MTTACATQMTVSGTVTSVRHWVTREGSFIAAYVGGRPVSFMQTGDCPVPRKGQHAVITGRHVIGDAALNMADAVVTVTPWKGRCITAEEETLAFGQMLLKVQGLICRAKLDGQDAVTVASLEAVIGVLPEPSSVSEFAKQGRLDQLIAPGAVA